MRCVAVRLVGALNYKGISQKFSAEFLYIGNVVGS